MFSTTSRNTCFWIIHIYIYKITEREGKEKVKINGMEREKRTESKGKKNGSLNQQEIRRKRKQKCLISSSISFTLLSVNRMNFIKDRKSI